MYELLVVAEGPDRGRVSACRAVPASWGEREGPPRFEIVRSRWPAAPGRQWDPYAPYDPDLDAGKLAAPWRGDAIPPADIYHVVPAPAWQSVIPRAEAALGEHGVAARLCELVAPRPAELQAVIRRHRPRAVVIHAFCLRGVDVVAMAEEFPDVAFMSVLHANQNHVLTWPQYLRDQRVLLTAARDRHNCYFSTPDSYAPWVELGYGERFVHWPNPVQLPEWIEPARLDPPVVALVCREDWMKAIPAQISAAALLQRRRGTRTLLCFGFQNANHDGIIEHAAVCGLNYELASWVSLDGWFERLRSGISLVLQATFADSFNYVSIDAASCGRPFVGSYAIRHTPIPWRVDDPNNSHEIAAKAEAILDNYRRCSRVARELAEYVARRNNREYAKITRRLLED